jgi:predicted oxidoreductase
MEAELSRIIQGCMTWGVWGKDFSSREIINRIEQNVDLGVTTFDHADIYGDYTTEASFGQAFHQSSLSRDKIQLISKCGIQLINESRQTYVKHYDYDATYIIKQAEQSLQNLKTDYIDLFLLHRPSPLMQLDEILQAITMLKKSGKIRDFGVSNFTPHQMDFLSKALNISANQIQCSLSHFEPLEDDTLFYHQQHDIMTMAWSPLGGVHKIDELSEFRQTLYEQSEKYKCSESQIVLAWLLKHPAKIHPVLGTSQTKRIEEAIEAMKIDLSLQDWFVIYEASRGKEVD